MLLDVVGIVFEVVAVALLLPVGVLLLQVVAAVLPRRGEPGSMLAAGSRPRLAVLMPAHDEAAGIAATVERLRAQLAPADRFLVVADNCSDATARLAAASGAEVIERRDPERRGKGYALDFGVRHLATRPPQVVVVVDADCDVRPGSLERLAQMCMQSARPVQALYSMGLPPGAGLKGRIAAFAWVVKNHARPLGSLRLGLPCQLMGTGMAFPWPLIESAPLASGHIVEDLQLGLDLAAAGAAPLFCPGAEVTSVFPAHPQGVADQRARWEQGHVSVVLQRAPRALWQAIVQRRPALAAIVLDLSVPPLSLLLLILVVQALATAVVAALGGARVPLWLALLELGMLALAIGIAWAGFGRRIVSLGELLGIPLYVLGKVPLYARFFRRGKREWVRARRDHPDE